MDIFTFLKDDFRSFQFDQIIERTFCFHNSDILVFIILEDDDYSVLRLDIKPLSINQIFNERKYLFNLVGEERKAVFFWFKIMLIFFDFTEFPISQLLEINLYQSKYYHSSAQEFMLYLYKLRLEIAIEGIEKLIFRQLIINHWRNFFEDLRKDGYNRVSYYLTKE